MARGDLVASRASISDAANRADSRYKEVEAELAALKPVSNKERDITAYLAQPTRSSPKRLTHCRARQAGGRLSVGALNPGRYGAGGLRGLAGLEDWMPGTLGLWLPLVGVLALELGAAFSVVLVRATAAAGPAAMPVGTGAVGSDTVKMDQQPGPVQAVAHKRSKPRRKDRRPPPGAGPSGPPQRGLAGTLKVLQGGAIQGSQRAIAAAIGTSKSTVQRALQLLAAGRAAFAAA